MRPLCVLGVYAHPADMITETGGTLAMHVKHGDRVHALVLTHGGRIHPNIYVEERRKQAVDQQNELVDATKSKIMDIKYQELTSAAKILGICNVEFLGYEDTMVGLQPEVVQKVADFMVSVRPDIVITHHPGLSAGATSSHELTGAITMAACASTSTRVANMDGVDPFYVRQVYFIAVDGMRTRLYDAAGQVPDVYVDISPVIEQKVRAMDQFVSQGYEGSYARKVAEALNGYAGMMGAHCPFAEAYSRAWPETYSTLPISQMNLDRDPLTQHRQLSRDTSVRSIPLEPSPTDVYRRSSSSTEA